jgi:hypothetical protein
LPVAAQWPKFSALVRSISWLPTIAAEFRGGHALQENNKVSFVDLATLRSMKT